MKKISIVTPCYNEEKNVRKIYEEVKAVFQALPQYEYEHIFIDNASTDATVTHLRELALEDHNVKVIMNARNFGPVRSPYYGLLQARGDAVVCIAADLQEPPALIADFLEKWEQGFKIVAGVKVQSDESKYRFYMRKLMYRVASKIAEVKFIKNFHGFGLYDKAVISLFKNLDDPYPYLRGMVSELGYKIAEIPYRQQERLQGKSKANLYVLYDWIMLALTSYSKFPIRIVTITGFFLAFCSFIASIIFLTLKIFFWSSFTMGMAPLLIGLFFFSSIQLFFMGILGEYVLSINTRIMKRPLVVEEERINL
ncbi:MAG TPA: glycosyltransferase [Gammaproteobacteria bacterium]|nr:glycosyltransferase [Gammaproteobacteria bacterium]